MRKKMTFREDQITDMILYMVGSIDSEKEPDEQQRIENLKRLLQIIDELIGEVVYAVDLEHAGAVDAEIEMVGNWLKRMGKRIHEAAEWISEITGEWIEEEEGC